MPTASIESRTSWIVVMAALAVLSLAFGAPLLGAVALKPIAEGLGIPRSVAALAGSAASMGSAVGGLLMGWVAERIGARKTAVFGTVMVAAGLLLAAGGQTWQLLLGFGLLVGFLGMGSLFAPLITLVSRWFDRRRGTALALVASGQYVAGALLPNGLEWVVDQAGWQVAMRAYAAVVLVAGLPLAALLWRPPAVAGAAGAAVGPQPGQRVLGLRPGVAMGLISAAIFLCCIPMALPQSHLVAFCSDLGLPAARGAAMMTLMLALAFVGRQLWGWMADRLGGLPTVLAASLCQGVAIAAFMTTQDEAGLFAVSALFGVGFSGLVPAYVVAVRELFPDQEAGWRVPVLLLFGQGGMAVGSWLAGAIYDHYLAYAPAFAVGVAFNLANLVLVAVLVLRKPGVAGPIPSIRPSAVG